MKKIIIVDTDSGNILSVCRALEKLGYDYKISKNIKDYQNAGRIILPGVGSFKKLIDKLDSIKFHNLLDVIKKKQIPLLGICVGMQVMMTKGFEFGEHKGLNLIEGEVKLINKENLSHKLKIPNINWLPNKIMDSNISNEFKNMLLKKFYFIHSYCCEVKNDKDCLSYYDYGNLNITSCIKKENFLGVQFHPEKSGSTGLNFLNYFLTKEI